MNIQRIELTNYGSWADLNLPIEPGVTLISGANGAGKSTILSAAEFALFGATSDAGRLIRRGTDEARVRVTVEVASGVIFVERTIRLSGARATVSLTLHALAETTLTVEPITAATVTETQAIIDRLLGVTRETLRASALSMQGDGAAFCEARPADRKRVLLAALPSMELWPLLHDQAKAELRAATDAANVARAELERLDGAGLRAHEAHSVREVAAMCVGDTASEVERAEAEATRLAAEAEAAREARRQHAAAVEAEQRARADHQRAGVERQDADEALARAKAAAANAPSVEDAEGAFSEAIHECDLAETAHRKASDALLRWRNDFATATQARADLLAESETGNCARCGQPLHADVTERLDAATAIVREFAASQPDALVAETTLAAAREAAQDAQSRLAEAKTIQSLAGSIDAAQQRARDAFDRQNETAEQLRAASRAIDALREQLQAQGIRNEIDYEGGLADAQHALATARAAHSSAAAELARAEEAAKVAEREALLEQAARDCLASVTRDAAIAGVLASGFSPTGVPAMIVDSILGDLADEANRVLAELASPIRVDLRSQRATKDGRIVDALDIIVTLDAMQAAYETLSGGERTRVALALRAALTRLLASKRGARVRLLVCDEPSGLDAQGSEAFADVLGEFVRAGVFDSCIVITHDDRLADRIDRVIRVEKDSAGVSRLADRGPTTPGETEPDGAGYLAGARETSRASSPGIGREAS